MPVTSSIFLGIPGIELFKTLSRGDTLLLTTPCIYPIGPLHDPVTWCKITHGEQVAQWDFQNKATPTNPP